MNDAIDDLVALRMAGSGPPADDTEYAYPPHKWAAQPDEPQGAPDLAAIMGELKTGATRFRDLPRTTRYALVLRLGKALTARLGASVSMAEWDAQKASWMPTASGVCKMDGWPSKWAEWQSLFATTPGTPSGESA